MNTGTNSNVLCMKFILSILFDNSLIHLDYSILNGKISNFLRSIIAGDVISYGTECRIKHLATMKYLVVEKRVDGAYEVCVN